MLAARPESSRCRSGAIILEFLIVFGIVTTLLTLLLPAIVTARAAARRTQCLNNLKNLSLALQNYQELHDTYPPGYVCRNLTAADPAASEHGSGWAWGAMVLPHVDQYPIYQTFDFRLDVPGVATVIPSFLCPEGLPRAFSVTSDRAGLLTLSPSNFVGVAGLGNLTSEPGRPAGPGMMYRNSHVRLDDVADGASQTLLLGERGSLVTRPDGSFLDTNSTWVGAVSGVFRNAGEHDEIRLEGPASLVAARSSPGAAARELSDHGKPRAFGLRRPRDD